MGRFERTERLLGREAMARLRDAHVAVVGLGAVGSYAVEGLVRAGVGSLRIVDFDVIRPSNINRQLYAADSTLGRPKTEVACERVADIHPDCRVEALTCFSDETTRPHILRPPLDVVIDAIDSVGPKIALLADCVRAGLPVVSSMGAASRLDPGAVRVGDISETQSCPLARHVRLRLRRMGIAKGVRCVYSMEPPRAEASGVNPDGDSRDGEEEACRRGRDRRPLGSFSCLTGIFGLTAAAEALSILLGDPGMEPRKTRNSRKGGDGES